MDSILKKPKNDVETRVDTRAHLKQLVGKRAGCADISGTNLNRKEVAAFIVEMSKNMWMAAQAGQLIAIATKLESVFCEAYLEAGGKFTPEIARTNHQPDSN